MDDVEFTNELRLRKLKILSEHYAEDERRRKKLAAALAEIDQEMARVANDSNNLPCLVRTTPGPDQKVYHSEDAPCGRVQNRDNFGRYSEEDAYEAGETYYLKRCTACDWKKAAEIHAQREPSLSP